MLYHPWSVYSLFLEDTFLERWRTVKVGRAHKGDVDAEIPMVRGAVQAEVDTKGHRRPCRILLSTIKAKLAMGLSETQ